MDTKNIDNKEELGKVFDEEVRKYNEEKSGIEQMLENIEDPQERKELQTKLDDLDKKYSSISGANEFRDMTSKELNKIKNRIADNLDYSKTKTITGARSDGNYKTENMGASKSNVEDGRVEFKNGARSEAEIGEFDVQEYLNKGAQQKGAKGDQQIDEKDITQDI